MKHKKYRSRARAAVNWIFKFILIVILTAVIGGGIFAFISVRNIIRQAPDITPSQFIPSEASTYIYDQDGNRQVKLTLPEANRDLVSIDMIPEDLQNAVVAIEDERFYSHHGIDPKGILRALVRGVVKGEFSEGASTITQQLLKNSVFPGWVRESSFSQRLKRKIQEQYLALKLEKMLSKKLILEDYLNTINLGAGCYGVQSAAYRYFGKDVSQLTLSECSVIAGITQNPTAFNPITNPGNNNRRRIQVLDAMLRQGYIDQEQYGQAKADDVYTRIKDKEDSVDTTASVYTYYQDALIGQVIQDLQEEKGYSYQQAYRAVYAGGLRIYSAQDDEIQKICDEEFENPDNFPSGTEVGIDFALSVQDRTGLITNYGNEDLQAYVRRSDPSFKLMYRTADQAKADAEKFLKSVVKDGDTVLGERVTITPQPQASCVIIDPACGLVKAVVGGRGKKEASLTLNRAVYTKRQPGSTFKILAVYAPAIEKAGKTLETVYKDEPYTYQDGTPVRNSDGSYHGDVTIREAIVRSLNVPAVKCLTEIGPAAGFEMAEKFGITTLVDKMTTDAGTFTDIGQTLALGGLTYGVTNLELTGAFAAIENEGRYIKPRFYTQVLDMYGNMVLDNSDPGSRTVISSKTASLLTLAMRDVITDPEGTAYGLIDTGQMPAAGKTGTTDDYRDSWFVGYTPYLACGVWTGYDNNTPMDDDGIYRTFSRILWGSIMKRISLEQTVSDFVMPDGMDAAGGEQTGGQAEIAEEEPPENDSGGQGGITIYSTDQTTIDPSKQQDHQQSAADQTDSRQIPRKIDVPEDGTGQPDQDQEVIEILDQIPPAQ